MLYSVIEFLSRSKKKKKKSLQTVRHCDKNNWNNFQAGRKNTHFTPFKTIP